MRSISTTRSTLDSLVREGIGECFEIGEWESWLYLSLVEKFTADIIRAPRKGGDEWLRYSVTSSA